MAGKKCGDRPNDGMVELIIVLLKVEQLNDDLLLKTVEPGWQKHMSYCFLIISFVARLHLIVTRLASIKKIMNLIS